MSIKSFNLTALIRPFLPVTIQYTVRFLRQRSDFFSFLLTGGSEERILMKIT